MKWAIGTLVAMALGAAACGQADFPEFGLRAMAEAAFQKFLEDHGIAEG